MAVVSIVSWNLLAPSFAQPSKYPWAKPTDLDWVHREAKIVKQLSEMDADIVCLQEVEVALWDGMLRQLDDLGYEGVLQETKRGHPVANAVLLRRGLLRVVRTESRSRALITVLAACEQPGPAAPISGAGFRTAVRESARPLSPLYLGNVHLEAGGDKGTTRLNQLRSLLRRMKSQQEVDDTAAADAPLLLTGDFNFDRSADLHRFLSSGSLPNSGVSAPLSPRKMASPLLPLRDAYLETPPPWGPALRSSYRNGRLLDYVWTSPSLSVVRTMPVCDFAGSSQPHQLPSSMHPSDHLPIGALVSWPGGPPPATRRLPAWQDIFVENVQPQPKQTGRGNRKR